MNNSEHLIDRNFDDRLRPILDKLCLKIRDTVDFGAEIIKWDLEEQTGGEYLLPALLFLRNQIELFESISTLIKDSLIEPCNPLLRAATESYFYIEFLNKGDVKQRGYSFLVWDAHRNIQLLKKLDGKSEQAKQFRSKYLNDKFLKDKPTFVFDKADYYLNNSESLLSLPGYKEVNEEFLRVKSTKRNRPPEWYSLFNGPGDLEKLAYSLELSGLYEGLYRTLSNSVHGTNILRGKISRGENGELEIMQIRLANDAESITLNCLNIAVITYMNYIKNRIPSRQKDYESWYLKIRDFYLGLTKDKK